MHRDLRCPVMIRRPSSFMDTRACTPSYSYYPTTSTGLRRRIHIVTLSVSPAQPRSAGGGEGEGEGSNQAAAPHVTIKRRRQRATINTPPKERKRETQPQGRRGQREATKPNTKRRYFFSFFSPSAFPPPPFPFSREGKRSAALRHFPGAGSAASMMMRRVAPSASSQEEAAAAAAGSGSTTGGVPGWLEALLGTRFFLACAAHPGSPRNECNMFCIDCRATPAAFCYYCRSHRHAAHRVIQIRRSSYHDVVRVTEVDDVLDTAGVQTYVINSARVLFLNERPQPRGAGAAAGKAAASPYNCEICGRALLDPFRFCSLGCKLVDTKRHGHEAAPTANADDAVGGDSEAEAGGSNKHGARPQGRRRKGTPHRAPFGS